MYTRSSFPGNANLGFIHTVQNRKQVAILNFNVTFMLLSNMKEISHFRIPHFLVWMSLNFGWMFFEMVMRFVGSSESSVENKNLGLLVQASDLNKISLAQTIFSLYKINRIYLQRLHSYPPWSNVRSLYG